MDKEANTAHETRSDEKYIDWLAWLDVLRKYETLERAHYFKIHVEEFYSIYANHPCHEIPAWVAEAYSLVKFHIIAMSPTPPRQTPKPQYPGYVYLLQSPTSAWKIGRTVDPENRQKTFSVKLPFEVSFECLIKTDDMLTLERELHARFADRRINGEWFELQPEDIQYIKSLPGVVS